MRSALMLRFFALIIFAVCLVPPAWAVGAHPADEIIERDLVHVRPDSVMIDLTISAGSIKLLKVWTDADTNDDKRLSDDEREQYGAFLASGYEARVDDAIVPVAYEPGSLQMRASFRDFALQGADPNGALVKASFRIATGSVTARRAVTLLVNHYNAFSNDRPPELYPDAAPGVNVVVQGGNDVDLRLLVAPAAGAASPTLTPPVPPSARGPNTTRAAWLQRLVRAPANGPLYAALGMAVAVLLGALHALTPGHGKTMVAAYLVGSKGRVRDAVVLGGVVTLTHTGSVIVLGLLTLLFTHAVVPDRVIPWIECVSGALVAALGVSLLRARLRVALRMPARPRVHAASPAPALAGVSAGVSSGWHEHDDGTEHAHGFLGAHSHRHAAGDPTTRLSPRALILMGIGGGIVPCPDALAILLVAIAAGHLVLGLAIILGFSVGLAAVLIALGVAIAGTRLFERGPLRRATGSRAARWIAPASAAFVVLIGVATLARAVAALVS